MASQKTTIIAVAGLGLTIAALWWLVNRDDSSSPPVTAKTSAAEPEGKMRPPIKAAARPSISASDRRDTALSDAEETKEDPAASEVLEEDDAANTLKQLIAMRAIESQVEVSEFLDKNAALAKEKVEDYCKEAGELPPLPIKKPRPELLDASEFMLPRVDWYEPERQGGLHLPEEITNRLQTANDEWLSKVTPADYGALDFSWMKELLQFGTWDLMSGPAAGEGQNSLAVQIPNYLSMLTWVRLRLARALAHGDFADASREVRHLASLLYSHQIMLGDTIALFMLQIERQTYNAAVARGMAVDIEPPPSVEMLVRQRELEKASSAFFWPGVDPEVMKTAIECTRNRCMAMHEAAWVESSIGPLAPEGASDNFWSLYKDEGCSEGYAGRLRDNRTMTLEYARSMFNGPGPLEKWPAQPTPSE